MKHASETASGGAALREQLQATLGGSYTIERELGGGGMSRVFLAEDTRLGRRVVVKVLPPELSADLSARRFELEVRLAARLQHPNIVPVLGVGEREGLAYYTMPYIEGESLRARLARDAHLPLDVAVSVLRDVARALEHAHAHGVVHRDIKPENILLVGSAAAVADFGIAKALDAARTQATEGDGPRERGETLTRVGTSLGTPAYMSPEQAAGDPDVDGRADIYAWGVVAYELLSGATPFSGRSVHQLVTAQISETPAPLATVASTVPPALAGLVMRCLEKDVSRRPQTAAELLTGLETARTPSGEQGVGVRRSTDSRVRRRFAASVVAGIFLLGIVAVGVYRARSRSAPVQPVLAVLPFENVGMASDEYFADGLTEEVRARLTGVSGRGLLVIAGTSTRPYKGSTKPLRDIARELGATHLLTGTVRWDRGADGGGRVRISPELVRASDQANVWSEPIDLPEGDVFALQSQVAERVATALDVALLPHERETIEARPTRNVAAYDAYLRGITGWTRATSFSAADRRAVAEEFERAVALDSNFAEAYAQLADVYLTDYGQAGDPIAAAAALAKARDAIERSWALDSTLVDVRLTRFYYLRQVGENAAAERLMRETAIAAPGNAQVLAGLAGVESGDAAVALRRRALAIDPRNPGIWGDLAGHLDRLYRHREAIEAREREIMLAPMTEPSYALNAASHLLWRGDTLAARAMIERAGPAPAWTIRLPGGSAGGAIWRHVLPETFLHARDTITLAGFLAGPGGLAPELYHLMKLRHFALTNRSDRARAHADSLVGLLEPALQAGEDARWFFGWYSRRSVLAEAYATLGRRDDAGRQTDRYVNETRQGTREQLCHALHNAAFVDVMVGRKDNAVARLTEALGLPCGHRISRALLRADASWASLRGHPGFERLITKE